MAEEKNSVFIQNMSALATPEGIQKYILGCKKNGQPRAVYDVVKDYTKPKKKKKGKKGKGKGSSKKPSSYSLYVTAKKKKKKHKKGGKHWHI